jgi:elongation factor Ts
MSNNVSLELIKTLRERSGAGMMDCKKALDDSQGNIEAALEAMRIKGQAKADTKAGRTAAEGWISVKTKENGRIAAMVEINCETDFAAGNEAFRHFANTVTDIALAQEIDTIESLLNAPYESITVDEARKNLVAKIGENVQIRRIAILKSDEEISHYVHNGRIGALVKTQGATGTIGKDVAMHIVASHPVAIDASGIPETLIKKEKEIALEKAKSSGKPDNLIEKIAQGQVDKFKKEMSLVDQPFVKDPSITVGELLKPSNTKVLQFIRFEVGEGIEKSTENFAEEVMKQAQTATKA